MAKRFLRLDLSAAARDFESVAVEPGLPLLDKLNTNYRILWKWLGRLIAEPEWHGDSADLFVCDDQQGRLDDVKCEPADTDDLRRNRELNQDLKELARRLRQVKPEPKEAKLHETITRHFGKLTTEAGPTQRQCHFFKYRDAGVWRLVWGWGYQRKDLAPASPTICTNPSCSLLFVRHSEGSRNCPDCEAASAAIPAKPRKPWLRRVAVLVAVALLAGLIGWLIATYWPQDGGDGQEGLFASPEQWVGPAGSQVQFAVIDRALDGNEEDVSKQVIALAEDPKIVRLDGVGTRGYARAPGKTDVTFIHGGKDTQTTVEVKPPKNPARITLQPSDVTLGLGTTQQLRVLGETDGEEEVDLTEAAEWEPVAGGNVYCYRGLVEGVAAGETSLVARYRATPDDPYVKASAKVTVVDEEYQSLKLEVAPTKFAEGGHATLEAGVITKSGTRRSVLGSSQLIFQIDPPELAGVEDGHLRANRTGKGIIRARFGESLTAEQAFQVTPGEGILHVRPEDLRLFVGETAELQVVSGSREPVRVVSSAPGIVEVVSGCRVTGLAPGKAELTVAQEARMEKVPVEVLPPPPFDRIAIVPNRVSVPVDGTVPLRVVGSCDEIQIDLAPDQIVWKRIPTSTFAELDLKTLEIRGRRATGWEPQRLTAGYRELEATAEVDVVAPPLRIELTPAGPVELPVGLAVRLHAWAEYGDGRRVELSPTLVQWELKPEDASGIELDRSTGTVRATEPGGPVDITATHPEFRKRSNSVEFRSVDKAIPLVLEADRSLILVHDTGRFRVSIPDEAGLGLSIEGVGFESSDADVLAVDARTGAYRAMAPGAVTVTANHPQAEAPAQRKLVVVAPDDANLVLRPAEVRLMVDGRQPLELYLVTGDKEESIALSGGTGGAQVSIGRPEAVEWKPPVLVGTSPSEPFAVAARYADKTAGIMVTVLPPSEKPQIRVVPDRASLAPGQPLSPRVEQRLPGTEDQWQEVDAQKVTWSVPDTIVWTPPSADLPPRLMLSQMAEGPLEVDAEYRGSKATLTIDVTSPPDLGDGKLVVVRNPVGEELPVGRQQEYTVMIQNGAQQVRAADVEWQPAFENDYVRWEPPVLTARAPGHEQHLSASAGDQKIAFVTRIVPPPPEPPDVDPFSPSSPPVAVHIISGQTQPITIPVGARFASFRVEATFADAPPSDVTRQATLYPESVDPQPVAVAVEQGRLCGRRPGTAVVQAEYNGVRSTKGLRIEVVDEVELTSMEIEPATVRLGPEESADLRVMGFAGSGADERLVGDITSRPDLVWRSDNPDVIEANGPNLTAHQEGRARVTVTSGSLEASLDVTVGVDPSSPLVLRPRSLRLKAGESKWLGRDVTLTRDGVDFIGQASAGSSDPLVVLYNDDNRSLEGISPGEAEVAITYGGERFWLPVEVEPDGDDGEIVIEPAADTLVEGESQDLHVLLITDAGARIDRTGSALLQSSNPGILAVNGNRVTGIVPGNSEVVATLPGIEQPGRASFTVTKWDPTELTVLPPALRLAVGDEASITIIGVGPGGRRQLSGHPDLTTTAGGDNPDAIEMRGATRVRGVAPGKAALQVNWRNLVAAPVPVEVSFEPITMLSIEPRQAFVEVDDRAGFQVFARQGDGERPVGVDDGVELNVADPSVARRARGLSVVGVNPGTTEVTALLGPHSAVARITVIDSGPPAPIPPPIGMRFIPDVLTLQLGVPGASVRIVNVLPDGTEIDVDHRARIDVDDPEIAKVEWTASGPVFKPEKEGQTQATASHQNLTTGRPLQILVVDTPARLEARPDPFLLTEGETGEFGRVQLVPQGGGRPIDVDYRVQPRDESIVAVDGEKTLRGVAAGQAQVTVSPVGVGEKYAGLRSDVTVEVEPALRPRRLVLTGPSQTTVNAEAEYRVELAAGGSRRDVTHDGAVLVLDRDQRDFAEAQPGCTLVGKEPGTVNLRARYNELISNVLQVRIAPVHSRFETLALEIERQPLSVREVRPYTVWGYPAGGGPRQDLTAQVTSAGQAAGASGPAVTVRVVQPEGREIVSHRPPTLAAQSPGRFQLDASYGPDRRGETIDSETIDLEVVEDPVGGELSAAPSSITVRINERTPAIRVTARPPAGGPSRQVDVQWSSENEAIVAPDPEAAGRFVGREAGNTRLRAAFGDLEAFVDVTVAGDVFAQVDIKEEPEFMPGNRFVVNVEVEATGHQDAGLEFRVVTPGNPDEGPWKAAAASGNRVKVELTSPALRQGPEGTVYHLEIQARNRQQETVGRYPLPFGIEGPKVRQQPGASSN